MKKFIHYSTPIIVLFFLFAITGSAQTMNNNSTNSKKLVMKTYVIEREIPGVGQFTPEQLKAASQTSCKVLKDLGPQIEWIQSYVTGNKLYCIYKAENEELIREHAQKGGFPANSISEVKNVISPATAEEH